MRILLKIYFLLFLLSCGNVQDDHSRDVFIYGLESKVTTLDPGLSIDSGSALVISNICESLFGIGQDGSIFPKLVESYKISDDELNYTFYLKKNIKFHDGTSLNAKSVQFSLLRQKKTSLDYTGGSFSYWESDFEKRINSIDVMGEYILKINLNRPSSVFLSKLAMTFSAIISPTAVKKMKTSFLKAPVCSGPYKLVSWKRSEQILLERNENYWDVDKRSKFKRILIKILTDSSTRRLALIKGEIDLARMAEVELKAIRENVNLKTFEKPMASVIFLFLNNSKPPFNDKKVRRAVSHLVNKKGIVKNILFDHAVVTNNPIPPSMWGYNKTIKGYTFSIEKAKKLLEEAGYKDKTLSTDMLYNIESPARSSIAEILHSDMKKAGIDLNLKALEWGTFQSIVKHNKYSGMELHAWVGDYIDPDSFFSYLFSLEATNIPANNTAFFKNKEVDDLIDKASRSIDKSQRIQIYKRLQQIIFEEAVVIPMYSINYTYGATKKIESFVQTPTGVVLFNTIKKNSF